VQLVLGVDGGNSKTLAVLADARGTVLGIGLGGGGNHQGPGMKNAMAEISGAALTAIRAAGKRPDEIDAAFYALAGADLPEDFAIIRPELAALGLARRWEVDNDTMAGLRAGSSSPDAVVAVVGSGNNAAGRNAAGETIRLPGLGWISGDWGGGSALAQEAVRLVMRAWDGRGSATALSDVVLTALGTHDVEELILALYHQEIRATRLLAITPLIFEVAAAGDVVAQSIVERQAEEVVETAGALLLRLGIAGRPSHVVLAGSVFRDRTGILVASIRRRMSEHFPMATVVVPVLEPVLGAVLCGMDLLNLEVGESVRERLAESYAALHIERSEVDET
jgi:N-acetylglucosamine kinase-like BadF-type ATPase